MILALQDPAQTWDEPSARKRPRSFDSFFMWFPTEGEPYSTGQDQIADVIKDHLWVNPLKYFLGDVEVCLPRKQPNVYTFLCVCPCQAYLLMGSMLVQLTWARHQLSDVCATVCGRYKLKVDI